MRIEKSLRQSNRDRPHCFFGEHGRPSVLPSSAIPLEKCAKLHMLSPPCELQPDWLVNDGGQVGWRLG